MTRKYRIGFFKKLSDSTGHEVDTCQSVIEISARNKQQAVTEACCRFAGERHGSNWMLHADRIVTILLKKARKRGARKEARAADELIRRTQATGEGELGRVRRRALST